MEAIVPLLKEFGFPVALCIVLLYAIWKQNAIVQRSNAALAKAQNDRIDTLESIIGVLTRKVEASDKDRIVRADEYAHSIKDIAGRYSTAVREQNQVSHQTLIVLTKLIDSITSRPCQGFEPHDVHTPRARPPSSAELPRPPKSQVETDRIVP